MTKKDKGKTVERSRLALLGGLAAGAAGGGCGPGGPIHTKTKPRGYRTFGSQSYPSQDQGGDGGGGGHAA